MSETSESHPVTIMTCNVTSSLAAYRGVTVSRNRFFPRPRVFPFGSIWGSTRLEDLGASKIDPNTLLGFLSWNQGNNLRKRSNMPWRGLPWRKFEIHCNPKVEAFLHDFQMAMSPSHLFQRGAIKRLPNIRAVFLQDMGKVEDIFCSLCWWKRGLRLGDLLKFSLPRDSSYTFFFPLEGLLENRWVLKQKSEIQRGSACGNLRLQNESPLLCTMIWGSFKTDNMDARFWKGHDQWVLRFNEKHGG